MNAAERLQRIIQQRREWQAFGWGPILLGWTVALTARMLIELWTGPRGDLGFWAFFAALAAQGLLAFLPGARPGARQPAMHGFWVLIAVSAWFLGSWAPAAGLLRPQAAGVLELMFLAVGLGFTGILKTRRTLMISGAALAGGAVLLALFPVLWAWRPLLAAAAFGTAAAVSLATDRSTVAAS